MGNAPSYCARVLTNSMSNTWVKCTGYNSFPQTMCSEHKPISATFIVRCVRPTMSCFMKKQSPTVRFKIEELRFTKSTGPLIKKPVVLAIASFAGKIAPCPADSDNTASPSWTKSVPEFDSVTHSQEYLETSHLMFIVREQGEQRPDKAHRGTCTVPLFESMVKKENTSQKFEAEITHHGKLIGKMTGKFKWVAAAKGPADAPNAAKKK